MALASPAMLAFRLALVHQDCESKHRLFTEGTDQLATMEPRASSAATRASTIL